MPHNPKTQIMTEAIIKEHGGQAYFNIEESAKIIGCGRNTLARILSDAGITVKKIGTSKRISAFDLVMLMERGKVASNDSGSRV